jgi:hypothetical protein
MMQKLFLLNNEYEDLPVILETRYNSRFYPIGKLMGANDILNDRY